MHRGQEWAKAPRLLGGRGPGLRQPVLLVVVPAVIGLLALLLPHPAGIHPRGVGRSTAVATGRAGAVRRTLAA